MFPTDYNYLLVPGLGGIELRHWMRHWKRNFPDFHILRQADFQHPVCEDWCNSLVKKVNELSDKPLVLITHSLGCVTTIHAAKKGLLKNVKYAFMVAMPSPDRPEFHNGAWKGFLPFPDTALPFKSEMVYSENDEYCPQETSKFWADKFNSTLTNAGANGHLGSSANLEAWKDGQAFLAQFLSN